MDGDLHETERMTPNNTKHPNWLYCPWHYPTDQKASFILFIRTEWNHWHKCILSNESELSLCSDGQKANDPFHPIGQVDLNLHLPPNRKVHTQTYHSLRTDETASIPSFPMARLVKTHYFLQTDRTASVLSFWMDKLIEIFIFFEWTEWQVFFLSQQTTSLK